MRSPSEAARRLVYADWLEERGDTRAQFLRAQAVVRSVEPDHPQRFELEARLSVARIGLDPAWLMKVEPERAHLLSSELARCRCLNQSRHHALHLHDEPQDTECVPWRKLLDAIDRAATEQVEEFAPLRALSAEERRWIVTLPPSIGRLKSLKRLILYGSELVRLPPEIGELTSLEEFVPYTSYRLHWFPYELSRCGYARSTVSTRAIYGNFKTRLMFPQLAPVQRTAVRRPCSVCSTPFEDVGLGRRWISMRVGTDVLPLLVHACSDACLAALPKPPDGYVQQAHSGGLGLVQSSAR
ncbi:MAG: TIGR02996 domain-containing protein [Archangium sp.]|nr:TIGR02996 domain-containing protein [Archangium sp.]